MTYTPSPLILGPRNLSPEGKLAAPPWTLALLLALDLARKYRAQTTPFLAPKITTGKSGIVITKT